MISITAASSVGEMMLMMSPNGQHIRSLACNRSRTTDPF